jgi:transposase
MSRSRHPRELRERTVRMVFEHQDEHPSRWSAISSIAAKFGVSTEALRKWVRRAEIDGGLRPGLTTDERERPKSLERENKELRRGSEILRSAAASFGAELDRRPTTPSPTSRRTRSGSGSIPSARSCGSPRPRTTRPRSGHPRPGAFATRS